MALPLHDDSSLLMQLLAGGIPPCLLMDLLDTEGMRNALASELSATDVTRARADVAASPVWVMLTA